MIFQGVLLLDKLALWVFARQVVSHLQPHVQMEVLLLIILQQIVLQLVTCLNGGDAWQVAMWPTVVFKVQQFKILNKSSLNLK